MKEIRMTFLPFEKFVIESALSKKEAIIELMKNIEAEKTIRLWNKSGTKEFEGHLRGNEFKIQRIINYRNSFLPIIKGKVETIGDKARLIIDMRLQIFVIIFMSIWFGSVGLFFLVSLFNDADDFSIDSILFPGGMLLFGYLLTMGGYLFEANRAKDILLDITKGRIVHNAR
jgi:hypothetical protein